MPTVLRIDGFRFFFFSNEGREPPHIHIESGDGYAKFWLEPVALSDSANYNAVELRRLHGLIDANRELLLERWNEYFNH